jgi:hypothetical protein
VHKEIFFMSILAIILNKGGPVEQCVSWERLEKIFIGVKNNTGQWYITQFDGEEYTKLHGSTRWLSEGSHSTYS